ncbi:MAG: Lrp/AsnC family transcriptional regulator [Promethearchaeota archaeon]
MIRLSTRKVKLDTLNKQILLELLGNCRLSYGELGKRLGAGSQTIRRRLKRLITAKVIVDFNLIPTPAFFGEDEVMLLVKVDGYHSESTLLEVIGAHPRIYFGHTDLDGPLRFFAHFLNTTELAEIGRYCRQQHGVKSVESHILLREPGRKCRLTSTDLKILKWFWPNPRLSYRELARVSGSSSRRIRSLVKKILHPDGAIPPRFYHSASVSQYAMNSAPFIATISFHISSTTTNHTGCVLKIHYNDVTTDRFEVTRWLQRQFPDEYWYSYASASAPVSFHLFTVDKIDRLDPVLDDIRQSPHITHAEALIPQQCRSFSPTYAEVQLEKLIHQTPVR